MRRLIGPWYPHSHTQPNYKADRPNLDSERPDDNPRSTDMSILDNENLTAPILLDQIVVQPMPQWMHPPPSHRPSQINNIQVIIPSASHKRRYEPTSSPPVILETPGLEDVYLHCNVPILKVRNSGASL
jgi:hypothetical protein